jgi:hypothetical protein
MSLNNLVLQVVRCTLTILDLTTALEPYIVSKEGVYRARAILLYFEILERCKTIELDETQLTVLCQFFTSKIKDIQCTLEAGKAFSIL